MASHIAAAWSKAKKTVGLDTDEEKPPFALSFRSNTFFIIATVGVGCFTDFFLYGLVVPILPSLLRDRLDLPQSQIQSHVSGLLAAYAGASVLFSPVAGVIGDKTTTRRAPFLLGLIALLLATLMLYLGQSIAVLVIARILQGMSAAFVWTIGLTLCLDTVGPENLGKTIGSIFSFISVGTFAAPALGGVLYDKAGDNGVFGVGFAVIIVDFIMRLLVIEKREAVRYTDRAEGDGHASPNESHSHNPDSAADEEQGEEPDESSPLLRTTTEDTTEYKVGHGQPKLLQKVPLLYCFRNSRLLVAFLIAFVQALLLSSFDATVPTVAEDLFGFNSTKAGLLFIPLGIFDLIVGPLAGWAVDRYGTKPAAVVGYTFLVPMLVLLRLPHSAGSSDPKNQIILYCVLLSLCAIGLGIVGAPSVVEAGIVVEKYHKTNPEFFGEGGPYAQLYGMNSMVFSAGLSVGPLVAGGLKDTIGYGNMNAALAGLCVIIAVLSLLYIGGSVKWRKLGSRH